MTITGAARTAGVIGDPVAHSLSPRLHNYWLTSYSIDGAYIPLPVPAEHLDRAFEGLVALGFAGANVTVPHKQAALELCDEIDALARRTGAVNTLVIDDGRLHGSNTDVYGFRANIEDTLGSSRETAVVLGAGGAARAVIVALQELGFESIRLVNRTFERAETLAAELGLGDAALPWDAWDRALDGADLLVNTTSLGMGGQPPLDIDLDALPPEALVTDIVYTPLETGLLTQAAARGNPTVDGLGMLLHQARPGFRAWFGVDPVVDEGLRSHLLEVLARTA